MTVGARPNPATGVLQLSLSLPGDEPARLEVVDLNGRRVWEGPLDLGFGQHLITVPREALDRNGVYLIRVQQGNHMAKSTAIFLR